MASHPSWLHLWMRCLMILICTLMFSSGFVLLAVGTWIVYGATIFINALGSNSAQLNISFICIAMGALVALTSLVGCGGAWKESRSFLLLFFFIVAALFVAELVGTVIVLMYRELINVFMYITVGLMVQQASMKALQKMYMGPGAADAVSAAWNTVRSNSCSRRVIEVIREHSAILGATAGVICITESAAMSISMALFVKLATKQQENAYD